jgi:hypothetical protein
MPTRNRAHFLRRALASAREQTWTDLEIVVSDNGSTDGTAEMVQALAEEDARIRYVRRPTPGSMIESWLFAVNHARGELWTFLADDDALVPTAVETAVTTMSQHVVPMVVWRYAFYYHPVWHEPQRRNHLLLQPFTGTVTTPAIADTLARVFDQLVMIDWPQFSNSLLHRSVWSTMFELLDHSLPCAAGDCYAGLALLLAAERYAVIDQPLTLYGWWNGSFTAGLTQEIAGCSRQEATASAAGKPSNHPPLPGVPLSFPLTTNLFTSALLQAQRALSPRADAFAVNWGRYFIKTREEIAWLRAKGLAGPELERTWQEALAQQPTAVQHSVRSAERETMERRDGPHSFADRSSRPGPDDSRLSWRTRLRDFINRHPFWFHWETRCRPQLRLQRAVLLDGRRLGFGDILGAARYLPRLIARGFTAAHRRGRACNGAVI